MLILRKKSMSVTKQWTPTQMRLIVELGAYKKLQVLAVSSLLGQRDKGKMLAGDWVWFCEQNTSKFSIWRILILSTNYNIPFIAVRCRFWKWNFLFHLRRSRKFSCTSLIPPWIRITWKELNLVAWSPLHIANHLNVIWCQSDKIHDFEWERTAVLFTSKWCS